MDDINPYKAGGGYGFCYSSFIAAVSIAAIVTATMGLKGGLSLRQVSIASLTTNILNPLTGIGQLVVSILGLTGGTTMHVVASVTIAFSTMTLALSACGCCASGIACAKGG